MKFLFDLGGVFFDWDPDYFFKNIIIDTKEREYFLTQVCNDEWNAKQDQGRLIREAENELIEIFPNYENQIKMYYKYHRKMIKKTFKNSIEVLFDLKKRNYECYVLSNWSSETFYGMIDDYPFLKKFNGLIISGEEKLLKPNPDIYNLAISRFNLKPKQTIFIDDKLININAAKKLGFKTIHLTNPLTIKDKINYFLI